MHIPSESIHLQPHQGVRNVSNHAERPGVPARPSAPPGLGSNAAPPFQSPDELDLRRNPITLEGLMRAWGTSAPQFDLNADGTVNMGDLLAFLAQQPRPEDAVPGLAQPSSGPAPQADASAPDTTDGLPKLTVDGFDEAWGTDDSDYDLNGDGTVNMADLLAFLAQQEAAAAETDPGDALTDTPGELTEAGFDAAWGTADPTYDLNGDGTVNMTDLLQFLDEQNQQQSGGNGVPGGDNPTLLEQFYEAWGTDDPTFDFNADGTVDMADLLAYLAKLQGEDGLQDRQAGGTAGAAPLPAAGGPDPEKLAQSIIARFEAAGFGDRPPANARQIVDGLGLDELTSRLIIDHIAARYPQGLKLDLTG